MTRVRSPVSSTAAAIACFLLMYGISRTATAKDRACPEVGSTYRPNPEDWDKHYFYRLMIDHPPTVDDPLQNEEIWRFRMFSHRTGKEVSELRLIENCPAGGLCLLASAAHRNTDIYSNVIPLTKGFRQPSDFTAPVAIILPGFATRSWVFSKDDVRLGNISYTGTAIFPEMRADIIWIRVSCWHW